MTMKKIIYTLAVLLLVSLVHASQAPPVQIVNDESRECATFIGGDECRRCSIPDGWRTLSPNATCPEGYTTNASVDYSCEPLESAFCCSQYHSGSAGDCEDLVINDAMDTCAFVEDITDCPDLPDGWAEAELMEGIGKVCPEDYTWQDEQVNCVEEQPSDCTGKKNPYCCSRTHEGGKGDCEDVVIHHESKTCAFVEDIDRCMVLPSGWDMPQSYGSWGPLCRDDYTWMDEQLECRTLPGTNESDEGGIDNDTPEVVYEEDIPKKETGMSAASVVLLIAIVMIVVGGVFLWLRRRQ